MSFDALTLTAVSDELAPLVTGARMQKVVFVDELSVAVEFFAPAVGRTPVLLSAHLEQARVHRLQQLPGRGIDHETPFSLLVRKHLRNARVRAVHQPPLERVFELACEQRDAFGRVYSVALIVEAMGRRSNLVLVDEQRIILDAARRTPPSRNARRPVLPHLPYEDPPPQNRLLPEAISAATLSAEATTAAGATLARYLGDRVAGLSPLSARELAFRATGSLDASVGDADWTRVALVAREFLESHTWNPTLAVDADNQPVEYAPYALTHLSHAGRYQLKSITSISEAIETYYAAAARTAPRRGDTLAAERKALLAPLERAAHATARRVAALEHQLATGQTERDPLRMAGEAILAQQHEIALGATELEVDGQRIVLDPNLTPVENAQAYFARYRKARETEARVPELLDEARQTVDHLAQLRTLVEIADGMDAVRALRREVVAATGSQSRPDSRKANVSKAAPYRRVSLSDGWEALFGTSAEGNAAVTFDVARADDLWLHARGVPGAHVILRGSGDAPDAMVEAAAQLAAGHSAARQSQAVEVDVTPRRYVKKIPGGPPGLVRYTNERTVRVLPRT